VITTGTMTIALFIFGAFLLVRENLQNLLTGWGDQIQINAYLDNGVSAVEMAQLDEKIRSFPEIERVRYISQAQAWKDFRAALGANSNMLEGLPEDVLPASFEIFLKPAYRDSPLVEAVASRLRLEKGLVVVEYPQEWVDRIGLVVLALKWSQWAFGGTLFVATFFIVRSTVGLAIEAQKDEIELLRLVGAPEELVQAPFLVEGLLQGILGAALAVLGLWLLVLLLRDQMPGVMNLFGAFGPLQFIDRRSVAVIFVIGSLLGASGSLFSLRSFMKR
jgi:cell division transport system permease protein